MREIVFISKVECLHVRVGLIMGRSIIVDILGLNYHDHELPTCVMDVLLLDAT